MFDDVQRTLVRVVSDNQITVTPAMVDVYSKPSPLTPEILQSGGQVTAEFWPRIPVIPTMSAGATDGRFLRNAGIPTYGTSGLATDLDDARAHGKDDPAPVTSSYMRLACLYRLS